MATMQEPAAKRTKKAKKEQVICYAEDFDFNKNGHLGVIKTGKFRTVPLQISSVDRSPILIQMCRGPGHIPQKFGVDTNQYGKTYLTFNVPDEAEYKSMCDIGACLIDAAKKRKDEWWPKAVSDTAVEEGFNPLIGERKPKADGNGTWPGQMKVSIPLNADTGELKGCQVLDDDGSEISIHDLPGRKWDTIVFELTSIYFQGKSSWGIGPKVLVKLQLAENDLSRANRANVDFLAKPPPRNDVTSTPTVASDVTMEEPSKE
jgi:hypothetical protein